MCSGKATSIRIKREVLKFAFGNSRFRQKVNYVKHKRLIFQVMYVYCLHFYL